MSLTTILLSTLLTYTAPPQQRGRVIGLNQSAAAMGNIIEPLVSGYLFDNVSPNVAMGVAGAITLATLLLSLRIYRMPAYSHNFWWRRLRAVAGHSMPFPQVIAFR